MPESASHHTKAEEAEFSPAILKLLEWLDNLAHVVVAALLIILAATMLIHVCFTLVRQVPLIGSPSHTQQESVIGSAKDREPVNHSGPTEAPPAESGAHEGGTKPIDDFNHGSLELLSSILFAVIILELLRTIITYLQTHDIQAIMQEFLVVGIISSVRKILLVGAEASLSGSTGIPFIQEATGVLLNIGGILLLILGLYMLRRGGPKTGEKE